jgi:hypothetical protein
MKVESSNNQSSPDISTEDYQRSKGISTGTKVGLQVNQIHVVGLDAVQKKRTPKIKNYQKKANNLCYYRFKATGKQIQNQARDSNW